jgi:hypothetical protein
MGRGDPEDRFYAIFLWTYQDEIVNMPSTYILSTGIICAFQYPSSSPLSLQERGRG